MTVDNIILGILAMCLIYIGARLVGVAWYKSKAEYHNRVLRDLKREVDESGGSK